MRIHRRFAFILFSLLLALTMLACTFSPLTVVRNLLASPTATSTNTPIPTPTLTPTPAPPLALYGCAFLEECPGVSNPHDFIAGDLISGTETVVEFPYSVPLRVNLGWYALDDQSLSANMEHLRFFFKIDGNDYLDDSMIEYGYYYDENGNDTGYPGYFLGVVLSGWEIGQPHLIEYGYTIDAPINDGWGDTQPGTVTFIIRAEPTLAPTFTPEPTATNTPEPVVYTPTPSCPVNATIFIKNSTGETVNIFLTGPASFHFYLPPGDNTINVCEGGYSYTGYGCGGSYLNGELHSGNQTEFYCVSN